jgi:hypothetical protein
MAFDEPAPPQRASEVEELRRLVIVLQEEIAGRKQVEEVLNRFFTTGSVRTDSSAWYRETNG